MTQNRQIESQPTFSAHDQVDIEGTPAGVSNWRCNLQPPPCMLANLCPSSANEMRAPSLVSVLDAVLPRQVVVDGGMVES